MLIFSTVWVGTSFVKALHLGSHHNTAQTVFVFIKQGYPPVYFSYLGEPELMTDTTKSDIYTNSQTALIYLSSIRDQMKAGGVASLLAVYNVGAILVSTCSTEVQMQALETVKAVVTARPTQVCELSAKKIL